MSNNIYVITRSKTKQLQDKEIMQLPIPYNSEEFGTDHPGIVHMLNRPEESFELRLIEESRVNEKVKYDLIINNIIVDKINKKNYIYSEILNHCCH